MRAALALVVPVLVAVAGCGAQGAQKAPGAARDGRPAFLTVSARQLSQIGLARVRPTSWTTEVRTTGTVDWDGDHTTQAIAQVNGPISRIVVDLGRRVRAGDPLLYVSSPDLASAISAYRKAENRLDLARRTLERNRDLLAHQVIAQKDFEASQADYNDANTEVQNDLQALRILGVRGADIEEAQRQNVPVSPELAMRAPLDGVVVQKLVLPGQLVQASTTPCFLISDTEKVWVQGHLHDSELAAVRVGDPAQVRSQASPTPLAGVVSYIGAMIDPATRTTPVRIATGNREGLLKKDQFVDLVIRTSTRHDVLTVPTSAVLYTEENFPFVYRQVEPGRFARAVIQLGTQRGTEFEVRSGLRDGDTIVAEGGVFLQFAETSER
ncbi:MAG: efflux RND transporter periplasmic adaptor subunit [Bacteroidales bacterium]